MLSKYRVDIFYRKNEDDLERLCEFLYEHDITEWECKRHRISSVLSDYSYYLLLSEEDATCLRLLLTDADLVPVAEERK